MTMTPEEAFTLRWQAQLPPDQHRFFALELAIVLALVQKRALEQALAAVAK